MFLVLLEIAGDFHIAIYFFCSYIIHIYILFITLGNPIQFCKIIRACDVLSPSIELSFLHHKKVIILPLLII